MSNKTEGKTRPSPAALKRSQQRRQRRIARLVGLGVMVLLAFGILSVDLLTGSLSYSEGDIATEDLFYSGTPTTYESELATEEARNEAAAQVGQVFVVDDEVWQSLAAQIRDYGRQVALNSAGTQGLAAVRGALPGNYSDDCLYYMLSLSEEEVSSLFELFITMLQPVYQEGIGTDETASARERVGLTIAASSLTGQPEVFFKSLLEAMELPYNKAYDAVATRAAQDAAMAAVEPVQIQVQPGERLISRGSRVTAEQLEALEALGLLSTRKGWQPYLGLLLLLLLLFSMLLFYLRQFKQAIYNRPPLLLLVAALLLLFLLLAKLISLISFGPDPNTAQLVCLLAPFPACSMLLSILLDRNTAFLSTCTMSVCMGILAGGELLYSITVLIGGIMGILAATRLYQRYQFITASLWVAGANAVAVIAWGLIWRQNPTVIGVGVIYGLVNGVLSSILAMGLMPFLESTFGVTTSIRLLELSNSNNPLLKRLMMEAPGTYNHSILVGNLAEAAADAIGANTLLVRVAAYYHDIGKLKRPQFFSENQRPGDNPHDKLQPALSAMIITSHPVDGGRMLRQARMPQEVIDIVEQHHGDSRLNIFYRRALKQADYPELVDETDFRYKGRKPQTREAGLVMLADSVQAAVQSLNTSDRAAIEAKVHEIIQSKMGEEDQLRECPLTFRDLDQIEQSFLMVLAGMNHLRVSYGNEHDKAVEAAPKQIQLPVGENGAVDLAPAAMSPAAEEAARETAATVEWAELPGE
ncbi:MAG: HDIG domain-containing protein [Firmicutes bacterium]|nr:HDIG domain-containing protein [Bacillota bacterium]